LLAVIRKKTGGTAVLFSGIPDMVKAQKLQLIKHFVWH